MKNHKSKIINQKLGGFSLTEVLLALGTLAVGMLLIAAVFPAGINLTTITSERTIAAAAADEAFAKIKLYGLLPPADPNWFNAGAPNLTNIERISQIPFEEFAYPSNPVADPNTKQYWWSALCKWVSPTDVQVTVFVSRKIGNTTKYSGFYPDRPGPAEVNVTGRAGRVELGLTSDKNFINDGYTIVDGATGQIYQVLERYANNPSTPQDESTVILLNNPFRPDLALNTPIPNGKVWVVPPPVRSNLVIGRYPCIAVYQKIITR